MIERLGRPATVLAAAWALLLLACLIHLGLLLARGGLPVDTDILALLPEQQRHDAADQALSRLSEMASRRVVLVLAGEDFDRLQALASRLQAEFGAAASVLKPVPAGDLRVQAIADFYAPWRDRLLSAADRQRLQRQTPEQWAQAALRSLYRPAPGLALLAPQDDPLGQFGNWLGERGAASPLRPRGGWLWMESGDRQLLVLLHELRSPAMDVDGLRQLQSQLEQAWVLAGEQGVAIYAAGIPVHAAAAAQRAQTEMSIIGGGASLGIALMMLLCFRRPRPMLLVLVSVSTGLLVALSLCLLVFDRVHLLTLVFGASLVGVAEDYAIHWLSARAMAADAELERAERALRPRLWLAFLTSALGYLALAGAPFPGLRQMALFSIVGLLAALLTVLLWLPLLHRQKPLVSRFSRRLAGSFRRWPRWQGSRFGVLLSLLLTGLALAAALRVHSNDDLRALQPSNPRLQQEQTQIGHWLQEASPLQFFLVHGADEAELLQREETLTAELTRLREAGTIAGYRALSDWLPSPQRQQEDRDRAAQARAAATAALSELLAEGTPTRPLAAAPLTLADWLAGPLGQVHGFLHLGAIDGQLHQLVQIQGLHHAGQLQALKALANRHEGVSWVDRVADYSLLLQRYRIAMSMVLIGAALLVGLLLVWRYRWEAWRVAVPTAAAMLAVLAWLGMRGEAVQLFHVLGLIVLLGMADDYGIFLFDADADGAAWLGVILGAINTVLAFGLLAFSTTPALSAFGLTLLIGILCAWMLAPCFTRPAALPAARAAAEAGSA